MDINKINDFIEEHIQIDRKRIIKEAQILSEYANSDNWGSFAIRLDDLNKIIFNSQESTGDDFSMSKKASIIRQSDKITSCPREEICKPETLPDTHTKDYGHKDLIYKDYNKGKDMCKCGHDYSLHTPKGTCTWVSDAYGEDCCECNEFVLEKEEVKI